MATTGTGPGAVSTGTGNTPSGNPGAGTHETTSAPAPVGTGTAGVNTGNTVNTGPAGGAPAAGTVTDAPLDDSDFRKDGTLRKDAARRIAENVPARGAQRSFNEVTGETTVTTVVDGRTVTFTEDGDTRGKEK